VTVLGGRDIEAISLAWEAKTCCDSIATIERVYDQTPGGAYICCWTGCSFARRDPEALWRHIHSRHGREHDDMPPADFDWGAYL
jgi:hypothetical protein